MSYNATRELVTKEILTRRQNIRNKIIVGSFLVLILSTILMKMITSMLEDCGLHDGRFHVGYKSDPLTAFSVEYAQWIRANIVEIQSILANSNIIIDANMSNHELIMNVGLDETTNFWYYFLQENNDIHDFITRSPNFLWMFTQFTWLTTVTIALFFTFRLFKYEDTVPSWLKWIMRQRTLALVAMYDAVVGIIFWTALAPTLVHDLAGDLFVPNMISTILVHAVIPVGVVTYYFIFVITDKKASRLTESFALKGLILPGFYVGYYILMTILWADPYGVSSMHEALTVDPVTHYTYSHLGQDLDWAAWAKQLWMAPAALLGIYIILGIITVTHNFLLFNLNKHYDPQKDHDAIKLKEKKLAKITKKMIRKEAKLYGELGNKNKPLI